MDKLLKRMIAAREAAYFTVSDMAVWFGVGRTNMDQWITQHHVPRAHVQKQLVPLLDLLEQVIKSRSWLPVPLQVKQHRRAAYIQKVKADAVREFPAPDTACRGNEVLGSSEIQG